MNWTHDPVVILIARLALALLFAVAVGHKLRRFDEFRETLADYQLLPGVLVLPAVLVLIVLEAGIALAMLYAPAAGAGSAVAVAVLLGYGLAILVNLARGRRSIDCGCGGQASRQPISEWLVVRNLMLAGVAWLAGQLPAPRVVLAWDYALIAISLATLALLYLASQQLLANAPHLRRLAGTHD